MRIAVTSDWWHLTENVSIPKIDQGIDLLIVAGNFAPFKFFDVNQVLNKAFNGDTFFVYGQKDFYGSAFPSNDFGKKVNVYGNIKIVGTTLWSFIPENEFLTCRDISGAFYIDNMTFERRKEIFHDHVRFLEEEGQDADIIVTHFMPSIKSMHSIFGMDVCKSTFVNDLDWLVEKLSPKIWIHGGGYHKFDYMIGDTRIICNPYDCSHGNYHDVMVVNF